MYFFCSLLGTICFCITQYVTGSGQCFLANKAYNPDVEFCCGEKVVARSTEKACCTQSDGSGGYRSDDYNPQTHTCCGRNLTKRRDGLTCCEGQLRKQSEGLCCQGKWNKAYGPATRYRCCGDSMYRKGKELCCKTRRPHGYQYLIHTFDRNMRCCGLQLYNKNTHRCGRGERILDLFNFTCGETFINSKQQTCCQGNVVDKPMGQSKCCGSDAYMLSYELCCRDAVTTEAKVYTSVKNRECCGSGYVDLETERCCNNKNRTIEAPGKTECCGDQLYNKNSELCCERVVHQAQSPGKQQQCCGNQSYNTTVHQCIHRTVYRRNERECFHQDTDCICSGEKIRGTEKLCCMGKPVEKGDPTHDRCCPLNSVIITYKYSATSKVPNPCQRPQCRGGFPCCQGVITDKTRGDTCCGEKPYFKASSRCRNGVIKPKKLKCRLKKQPNIEKQFCKYNSAVLGRIRDIKGRHIEINLTGDLRRDAKRAATLTLTLSNWPHRCPRHVISSLKRRHILLLTNKGKIGRLGPLKASIKIRLLTTDGSILSRVNKRTIRRLRKISC